MMQWWFHVSAQPLPPAVSALQPPQFGTHYPLASAVLPLQTLSVASLKLTASRRPTAPLSGSAKCLRFGHWLTLCTLNMHILILLTYLRQWRLAHWVTNGHRHTQTEQLLNLHHFTMFRLAEIMMKQIFVQRTVLESTKFSKKEKFWVGKQAADVKETEATHLRIMVIVSFRFCPWNGRDPVSISNCTPHIIRKYVTFDKNHDSAKAKVIWNGLLRVKKSWRWCAPWFFLRLWRFINHLLTYLLTFWETHHRATECHLPYQITTATRHRWTLLPHHHKPSQTDWYSIYISQRWRAELTLMSVIYWAV